MKRGKFIVIEGIDQSGKKTQSLLLKNRLKKKGYKVGYISFPKYNTTIGKLVRKCLRDDKISVEISHILLSANRWEAENEIRQLLEEMDFLICNRYRDSNIAYGLANGLEKKWLENLDLGLPKPDLTILLKVKISKALKRLIKRKKKNRYDNFSKDFYIKAQKAFIKIAKNNKNRYLFLW